MYVDKVSSYHNILFYISTLFCASLSYSQETPTLVISKGHHQAINSIDISPNDKYIASGSDDNHVKVYDLQMKQELYSFLLRARTSK